MTGVRFEIDEREVADGIEIAVRDTFNGDECGKLVVQRLGPRAGVMTSGFDDRYVMDERLVDAIALAFSRASFLLKGGDRP